MFVVRQAVLSAVPRVSRHVSCRSLHVSSYASSIQLKMPSLSPTMEEGTIVKWSKVFSFYSSLGSPFASLASLGRGHSEWSQSLLLVLSFDFSMTNVQVLMTKKQVNQIKDF